MRLYGKQQSHGGEAADHLHKGLVDLHLSLSVHHCRRYYAEWLGQNNINWRFTDRTVLCDLCDTVYKGYKALQAEDIADVIYFMVSRPAHVNVADVLIFPTAQASATLVKKDL